MEESMDLKASDFAGDRYDRLRLIPWWDQDKLSSASVLVAGAGALGNELVKNLALLGVGRVYVADMDTIEASNLTRSVLFRAGDVGGSKARTACLRAMDINPDVRAAAIHCNVVTGLGLGFFRRMDVVLGGLDNREARLFINQACYRVGVPWIDGAIEAMNGIARVFMPPEGPCYECTMTAMDWKLLNRRKSCALLTHEQMLEGKVPTTPTSSSVIAAIEVQEMLKLLHRDRDLPTLAGKGYVFNGLTHDSYVVQYQRKADCMSHDPMDDVVETPWTAGGTPLSQVLERAVSDLGEGALVEFDREIAGEAVCPCGGRRELYRPVAAVRAGDIACPRCGRAMGIDSFHSLDGASGLLGRTAAELGLPPLHILSGRRGSRQVFYEFTGDRDLVMQD